MDPTGKGDQPVDEPETEKPWFDTYDQKGDRVQEDPAWKTGR